MCKIINCSLYSFNSRLWKRSCCGVLNLHQQKLFWDRFFFFHQQSLVSLSLSLKFWLENFVGANFSLFWFNCFGQLLTDNNTDEEIIPLCVLPCRSSVCGVPAKGKDIHLPFRTLKTWRQIYVLWIPSTIAGVWWYQGGVLPQTEQDVEKGLFFFLVWKILSSRLKKGRVLLQILNSGAIFGKVAMKNWILGPLVCQSPKSWLKTNSGLSAFDSYGRNKMHFLCWINFKNYSIWILLHFEILLGTWDFSLFHLVTGKIRLFDLYKEGKFEELRLENWDTR